MVAQPGHTCRPSERLLARPDLSIIWTREPVDNHIALIALLKTTRDFPRMHDSGGAVEWNTFRPRERLTASSAFPPSLAI